MRENIVKNKSFQFALSAIELYKKMIQSNEYVLSKQLLRSATSIGANIEEADAGISKKDFTAKMSIASKGARESLYWIKLLEHSKLVEYNYEALRTDCQELIRLLTSIVKTSQKILNTKH